jgi:hypothetical protein
MENIWRKFAQKVIPSLFTFSISSYVTYKYGTPYISDFFSELEFQRNEALNEKQRKKVDSITNNSLYYQYILC